MKLKRMLSILLTFMMLLPLTAQARDMGMYIGNQYIVRDVQNIEGFDMLPILDMAEELGFSASFDGTTLVLANDTASYRFTIGSPAVYDQNGKEYGLDVVPQMINGKLMIPAKFFVDAMGKSYFWDDVTDSVFLGADGAYEWLIGTTEYKQAKNAITMIAADGRKAKVPQNEVAAWSTVGWYPEAIVDLWIRVEPNSSDHNKYLEFYADGTCYYEAWRIKAYGTYQCTSANTVKADFDAYLSNSGDTFYPLTCYYTLSGNSLTETGGIGIEGGAYQSNEVFHNGLVELYAPDEIYYRKVVVKKPEVDAWLRQGWYTYPVVYVYSSTGAKKIVPYSDMDAWVNAGWFTGGSTWMYSADGRKEYVPDWQVAAMEKVGWYTEPVIKMFSKTGKSCYVKMSEIHDYKCVGWYEPHELALNKTYKQLERVFGGMYFVDYWNGGKCYASKDYVFILGDTCDEVNMPLIQFFPGALHRASIVELISKSSLDSVAGFKSEFCADSHDFGTSLMFYYNNGTFVEVPCDSKGNVQMDCWVDVCSWY